MQTQGVVPGVQNGESGGPTGELELCSELHEGDSGWTPILEEEEEEDSQEVEAEEPEVVYQAYADAEEHTVEYPFLLWTVLVFLAGTAFGRCTVGR